MRVGFQDELSQAPRMGTSSRPAIVPAMWRRRILSVSRLRVHVTREPGESGSLARSRCVWDRVGSHRNHGQGNRSLGIGAARARRSARISRGVAGARSRVLESLEGASALPRLKRSRGARDGAHQRPSWSGSGMNRGPTRRVAIGDESGPYPSRRDRGRIEALPVASRSVVESRPFWSAAAAAGCGAARVTPD